MKRLAYLLYFIFFVAISLEVVLHIYNPFPFRQKADQVILPRNRTMIFTNDNIPVLEKRTVHTKNSLGFRGQEKPVNFDSLNTFVAVGGSATECFYLSDSNCWTSQLAEQMKQNDPTVWINNAGYQGHSTYGHFILINDFIKHLHPKHILIMTGYNEINREDIRKNESVLKSSNKTTAWGWMKRNSELVNIGLNIQRYIMADRLSVSDGYINLEARKHHTLYVSRAASDSVLSRQRPLVAAYQQRLQKIIDTCLANDIEPILMTQPILFGVGTDSITNVNLETVKVNNKYNGQLIWQILEKYNDATRLVARNQGLKLIDLAHEMPKCSLYFYDICHFSNEGSKKVSEIVAKHLN